jgi:DNA invertase Pin-like site-specific DNA recombinase
MKAALYARVSSDKQDVDLSIAGQLRNLRDYALRNNYEIVSEFVDEAESGRSTSSRPAFNDMIASSRLKNPPFEVILVWKLSRFARSRMDSITYKALLRSRGIRLVSINEPLDNTPVGQLLEGIIESVDEFYSANLGQDIKRGMRENASRGFFNHSKAPYGLHREPVKDGTKVRWKLSPDSDDSASVRVIRRIFDLAMKDYGCKAIAGKINDEGFRNRNGNLWNGTTVHQILTNEAYCGTLVWGGRQGRPAVKSGVDPVRVENAWPAIIPKANFNTIRHKMRDKSPKKVHPRRVASFYILSGILYCSCGHAMIGRSAKSQKYYYYQCNHNYKMGKTGCNAKILPKEKLENAIIQQLQNVVLTNDNLGELVQLVNEDLLKSHNGSKELLRTIDSELSDANARLARLYDALETGTLSIEHLAPRIKELRDRKDKLSQTRIQTEADTVLNEIQRVDLTIVKAYVENLSALLNRAHTRECKALLRSFIEKIIVNGNRITIEYRLPVPPYNNKRQNLVLPFIKPGGSNKAIAKPHINTFFEVFLRPYCPTPTLVSAQKEI